MKKFFSLLFLVLLFFVDTKAEIPRPDKINLTEGKWTNIKLPSETPLPIVNISLSFDKTGLLINAKVKDSHFKDEMRSWRYGDGFFINFVSPEPGEKDSTNKFYSFGFSLENGKPVSVLVNKDGKYFPQIPPPPPPQIKIAKEQMTAEYSILIPWRNVYPFHPLNKRSAGINIVYISQNDDRSRTIQRLVFDSYDTEASLFRRFIPMTFAFSESKSFQIAGSLKERILSGRKSSAKIFIRSHKQTKTKVRFSIMQGGVVVSKKTRTLNLKSGLNNINESFSLPKNDGLFTFSAEINDSTIWSDDVYKYSKRWLNTTPNIIKYICDSTDNKELLFAGTTLTYHFNELTKLINEFDERKDINRIKNGLETLFSLFDQFINKYTIFSKGGYLLCAFASSIDSALQPFSMMLPDNFDIEKKYNVMIALHGSGVDEIEFVRSVQKLLGLSNFIFVAPRGRDLSSWYSGKTEKDVIEITRLIKKLFNVDRTLLYGFSMGGYGVWKFGLTHGELFDGGIVLSGIPFNPRNEFPENDMNNYYSAAKKKIPFLAVHGTNDNSLDIKHTDPFIEKLKVDGFKIDYIRLDGNGHGGYNPKTYIDDWISKMNLLEEK